MVEIKVGDKVFFYPPGNRGGHGAYAIVTKVKRATFDCVEDDKSYQPTKKWNVHLKSQFKLNGIWYNTPE